MRRAVLTLVVGEPLLLSGLWLAWHPLALIAAGAQVIALALASETSDSEGRR